MLRSGTTLLARLLNTHPEVSILLQPCPEVFLEVKRRFLRCLGCPNEALPLGTLFRNECYKQEDLLEYLCRLRPSAEDVDEWLESADNPRASRASAVPDPGHMLSGTASLGRIIHRLWASLLPSYGEGANHIGAKEVLCEEFLPYLLQEGFACVLIVRDPRAIIASLNHGRGRRYGGRLRPTLFNIRCWRRSAAFTLSLEGRDRFVWVRYEDLVRQPAETLNALAASLGISPITWPLEVIPDHFSSEEWQGNSSFGASEGITRASVGKYKDILTPRVQRFVEAACLPEMRTLGYENSISIGAARRILADFRDPYPLERPELGEYQEARELEEEVRRLDRLSGPCGEDVAESYFICPAARSALARTLDEASD